MEFTLSTSRDWFRVPLTYTELADLTRFSIWTEIVCPATGDAVTVVPGPGIGGGDMLPLRNNGWMWCSLAFDLVDPGFVGSALVGDVIGDG